MMNVSLLNHELRIQEEEEIVAASFFDPLSLSIPSYLSNR